MIDYGEDDSFIDIDPDRLPEEVARQSRLFFTWCRKLADANLDAAEAKARLDLASAEAKFDLEVTSALLDKAIRAEPASYGLMKIVEASVAGCVLMQPEYKQAFRRANEKRQVALAAYNKAVHAAEVTEACVKALAHKKSGIEDLVKLELAGFHAAPRLPDHPSGGLRKASAEVVNNKVREALNATKKGPK